MAVFLSVFAAVLAADQMTKAFLWGWEGEWIPGVLNIANVKNTGSAMGVLSFCPAWLLSAAAAAAIAAIFVYVLKARPGRMVSAALGGVAGGAAGNLADRLLRGYVADLFETVFVRFYVFNLADAAIVAGCAVCAAAVLFGVGKGEKRK